MRKKTRLFALLLAVWMLAAMALPLTAAEAPTGKRKVVSVVYDTSLSMSQSGDYQTDANGNKRIVRYDLDPFILWTNWRRARAVKSGCTHATPCKC